MRQILLFVLIVHSCAAMGQDLTGIWRGNFNQTNYLREPAGSRYKFEVQIDQNSTLFQAVTYSYLSTVFYGKAVAKGTVNPKTQKVYLEELKIVDVRMSGFSSACIMTCFLQYSKDGKEEFLEGTYYSMNTEDSTNCGKGTVFLRRVSTSDFYKEPFLVNKKKEQPPAIAKRDELKEKGNSKPKTSMSSEIPHASSSRKNNTEVPRLSKNKDDRDTVALADYNKNMEEELSSKPSYSTPSKVTSLDKIEAEEEDNLRMGKLKNRVNEVTKTIRSSENIFEISLYDNGTIDNDTISVYLNNRLVINKQRLTDQPIQFKIEFEKNTDVLELTIYADNQGDVPPNTSLMIVKDGSKVHEVRLTSNETKNAVVRFKHD